MKEEGIIMNKTILVKALVNGIVSLLVLAVLLSLVNGIGFMEALMAPYTIIAAISAVAASYIGFVRKARGPSFASSVLPTRPEISLLTTKASSIERP